MDRDPEALLAYDGFVRAVARGLLRDEHRVDDVVQQTWIAAWSRGPGEARSIRAWLATVVRNLARDAKRVDARREDRERAAARAESVPSVDELLQREAARRRVVDAVAALDEPYRSAILLRYLDELPPRAIARRLGVPVETVKTRLKRGLDLVRARLDAQHGGRAAWAVALAPVAALGPHAIGGALSRAAEVLTMTTKAKVAWVALALVSAAALWFGAAATRGAATVESGRDLARLEPANARGPAGAGAVAPAVAESTSSRASRDAEALRPAARAAAASPAGSLRVVVTWGRDKSPAAGIGVRVHSLGSPENAWAGLGRTTDAKGVAVFPRVPAGSVLVQLDRSGSRVLELKSEREEEVPITIPLGGDVAVSVVDRNDSPVEGATVWIADTQARPRGANAVGTTGADGAFTLRDVGDTVQLCARHPRFAPSPLVRVSPAPGASESVRLTLADLGCEIEGRVLAPDGAPAADAEVLFGDDEPPPDANAAPRVPPLVLRSDEQGRFLARGLPRGTLRARARVHGLAPWSGTVEARVDARAALEIRLRRGAAVSGSVFDSAGRPLARAQVGVGANAAFDAVLTRSAADGTYRVECVPAGDVEIRATFGDAKPVTARLATTEGGELRWDAVFAADPEIRGRVVDDRELPLAGWLVRATESSMTGRAIGGPRAVTDAQGRFAIQHCGKNDYVLETVEPEAPSAGQNAMHDDFRFAAATATGVKPGDDVLLRVGLEGRNNAAVAGVVVGPDDRPLAGTRVRFQRAGASWAILEGVDAKSGAFRSGPHPAIGPYELVAEHEEFPPIARRLERLVSNGTLDVGRLRFERGGAVVVDLSREDGGAPSALRLEAERAGAGDGETPIEIDEHRRVGRAIRSQPLAPGAYRLRVRGGGAAATRIPFEIRAGEDTPVTAFVRSGVERTLSFRAALGAPALASARFEIRDARGELVWRDVARPSPGAGVAFVLGLRAGAHRVEATSGDGRKATRAFEVSESPAETIEIELR